jgi:hypothetical protein
VAVIVKPLIQVSKTSFSSKNYYLLFEWVSMGLFKKEKAPETKCKECGMELHDPVRLERHMKKAHKHASQRNFDEPGSSTTTGMW